MSASLPGHRALPESQYDLSTYWGRVRHTAGITDPRTLLVGNAGLEQAKNALAAYKQGRIQSMTPELWRAKKIVDSTLHPDTGEPVFLPFRMSCFVLSNLVVTAGMLTPGLGNRGTIAWQVANQSLNVAINYSNSNKSSPLSWSKIAQSYFLAVTASCSVAVGLNSLVSRLKSLSPSTRLILSRLVPFAAVASAGALNVFLMRGEEMRTGIDVFPAKPKTCPAATPPPATPNEKIQAGGAGGDAEQSDGGGGGEAEEKSLGKSKKAATLAVAETAASRVFNSSPIMVIPPLLLVRLQRTEWLRKSPRWTTPVNLGLILLTSYAALPLALAAFPQRQRVRAESLEQEFHGRGGAGGLVEFNRGI
ncbi:tricarboxylate carrier [Parathielavia hyrcaniae]|uniref:Tricarboxylate carrier n=1 Tax=Parathielavia hyrcaniae TaxID=113614 RepID=A0AAN6QCC2_9PEZI|nr:tricarboxylate carrier [Parathielavia hyrcaniae]